MVVRQIEQILAAYFEPESVSIYLHHRDSPFVGRVTLDTTLGLLVVSYDDSTVWIDPSFVQAITVKAAAVA